ncbi:Polysaccharide biosynthesis protein [Candidatus Accumulibacter aalborgensis]|uniref:Polysaccharide biosynthesis protein n=1 Tax=Candidatus Accumulibacter aalborgensis TaxID=1860102 RepID=A0A1A8XZ09_9PROT|nr:Polysaccharide biosynthesis protein [Candidatus Accumulibacter aalborgensis]
MKSVRTSLAFSLADSYLSVALQLASTLILSRLLTPTETGIFAVAAVLTALASTFRDFGVAEYLIQEKDLTTEKIRAAFAANIMVSWLMAALMFFSSAAVADFYQQPGVADVMHIQAINFLLIPFGAVTMAYFRRQLNYRPIFVASLLANITSFVVAVAGALAGFSYLSLAWAGLAGVVVTVGVSVIARPKDFPSWPSFRGMSPVVRFGKHALGIYFFGQIGRSAPEAVIGRALDMASVAFFSRANGLMEIFNRSVLRAAIPICLPYFAQERRAGQRTATGYLKATTLLTGIGWPFFIYIGFIAYSAIRLLYGGQWMPAVPLAKILCLVAVLELPYWLAAEVMIAEGRVDQSNKLQFLVQGMRLASLALVFPFGLPGACWGLAVAALGGAVTSHRFLHQIIGLRFNEVVRACLPSAAVAIVAASPSLLVALFIEQTEANYLAVFMGCSLTTGLVWLLALKVCNHPFWAEVLLIVDKLRNTPRRA